MPPRDIAWTEIRRHVNRLSIRDLSGAIIPALYAYAGRVLIAVDDMTDLTSTQQHSGWQCSSTRQVREMKHQAGVKYLDFTPVTIIAGALVC